MTPAEYDYGYLEPFRDDLEPVHQALLDAGFEVPGTVKAPQELDPWAGVLFQKLDPDGIRANDLYFWLNADTLDADAIDAYIEAQESATAFQVAPVVASPAADPTPSIDVSTLPPSEE